MLATYAIKRVIYLSYFALPEQVTCLLFGNIEMGVCGQAAGDCRHNFPSFNMPASA